jgi:hypothetical protein
MATIPYNALRILDFAFVSVCLFERDDETPREEDVLFVFVVRRHRVEPRTEPGRSRERRRRARTRDRKWQPLGTAKAFRGVSRRSLYR